MNASPDYRRIAPLSPSANRPRMAMAPAAESRKAGTGYAFTFAGGFLLSIDVPLLRLAGVDAWTLILVRGCMLFTALWIFWLFFKKLRGDPTPFVNGFTSVWVAIMACLGNILFLNAIHLTTVANVVFILAFNPMFAAILSWVFLKERIALPTMLAILCSLAGVIVIVASGIESGGWIGDLMALGVSFMLAVSLTLIRYTGSDQSMAPAFGSLLAAASVWPLATPSSLTITGLGWLALNGLLVMPMANAFLMIGPRYLPAPIVAMFYLIETGLTPVWMWLVFGETVSASSLVGGSIIVTTLVLHSLYSLGARRRR